MIAPENTVAYNFNPFPTQTPSLLPDPTHSTDSCYNRLTPCDSEGQCTACSLGEYKCVNVSEQEGSSNYYHFNGINVPQGQWCLPADNNPNPLCNSYTGKWIWSFDPEYCNSVSPGSSQCWKCECLYPSLYAGSQNGCNTQLACQNDSILSQSLTQPDNKLIASSCAYIEIQGQDWDPLPGVQGKKRLSGTDSPILTYTPYDQDKDGNPWFVCNCEDNSNGQFFARLPGDPHTCHLEPCFKYLGSRAAGLTCNGTNCTTNNCSCNCNSTNFATSPNGNYANTCVLISDSCGPGGYTDGQCDCGQGPTWSRECKNTVTGVNMNNSSLPDCVLTQNALGSECINPCEGKTCNHGAPCISCGSNSYQELDICGLNIDGSDPSGNDNIATIVHAICDCSNTTTAVPPGFGGYYGPSCSVLCLPGGILLQNYTVTGLPWMGGDGQSCNCCCSSSTYTEEDHWYGIYGKFCNNGFPTINQPADPSCLPQSEYSCSP